MNNSTDQGPIQVNEIAKQRNKPVFHVDVALYHLQGDHARLAAQTNIFLEYWPDLLLDLSRALTSKDAGATRLAARSFKEVLSDFTTTLPFQTAKLIEFQASQGDLSGGNLLMERLNQEVEMLVEELRAYAELAERGELGNGVGESRSRGDSGTRWQRIDFRGASQSCCRHRLSCTR